MQPVEASVVVPLSPEQTWDSIWDNVLRADELLPGVVALEDFQMPEDGTPRYRMVRKAGPFTMSFVSDYFVFERPHLHGNRALESPFGGNFYGTYEPTPEGTRIRWRWEIEPQKSASATTETMTPCVPAPRAFMIRNGSPESTRVVGVAPAASMACSTGTI
jgi:hypothetical protein